MPATAEQGIDLLDGISASTSKATLLERLNQAADLVRAQGRQRTGKLAEIEARVRTKYAPGDDIPQLQQVVLSATTPEWQLAVEFLGEWEGPDGESHLPVVLQRILAGGRVLLEEEGAK